MWTLEESSSHPVKSAGRVLDIFELLSAEAEGLSVTEISTKLGIARSSAHALVQTLAARGYLRRDSPGLNRFTLGVSFVQLGFSVSERLELRSVARGVLEGLVADWHETASLAVVNNGDIAFIDKVVSDRFGFRTDPRTNLRRPLHSHSIGKAVLADADDAAFEALVEARGLEPVTQFTIVDRDELREELRHTRERGYAIDQQGAVLGVCCVGAPIRDHSGRLVGAVSLSTIREYYRPDATGPAVRDAAIEISRAMGWNGDRDDIYAPESRAPEERRGSVARKALMNART